MMGEAGRVKKVQKSSHIVGVWPHRIVITYRVGHVVVCNVMFDAYGYGMNCTILLALLHYGCDIH